MYIVIVYSDSYKYTYPKLQNNCKVMIHLLTILLAKLLSEEWFLLADCSCTTKTTWRRMVYLLASPVLLRLPGEEWFTC